MQKSRRILCGLLVLGLTVLAWRTYRVAVHRETYAYSFYKRVDWWILSARCTQMTGAWLALCTPNGGKVPVEDVSTFDDRGHTLLANLVAVFKREPFDRADLVLIHLAINVAGILALAGWLWRAGAPIAALGALWGGCFFGVPTPRFNADAPATFFGETALALAAALEVVRWARAGISRRTWIFAAAAGLCIVTSYLLREAIGSLGLSVLILVSAVTAVRRPTLRLPVLLFCLAAFVGAHAATPLAFRLRRAMTDVPAGSLAPTHGGFHNLYMGLGAVENPWGIDYGDDRIGYEHVAKRDPQAGFGTERYQREVRRLYFDMLRQHPATIARIYVQKLWLCVSAPLRILGVRYVVWLLLSLMLLWRFRDKQAWADPAFVVLAAIAVLVAQAVLVTPDPKFFYPVKWLTWVLAVRAAERWMLARQARETAGISGGGSPPDAGR